MFITLPIYPIFMWYTLKDFLKDSALTSIIISSTIFFQNFLMSPIKKFRMLIYGTKS